MTGMELMGNLNEVKNTLFFVLNKLVKLKEKKNEGTPSKIKFSKSSRLDLLIIWFHIGNKTLQKHFFRQKVFHTV